MDAQRIARTLLVAGSLGRSFPALASAQQRVGVVTNVGGTAVVDAVAAAPVKVKAPTMTAIDNSASIASQVKLSKK